MAFSTMAIAAVVLLFASGPIVADHQASAAIVYGHYGHYGHYGDYYRHYHGHYHGHYYRHHGHY